MPTAADMGATGELVLLFDWSQESRHVSPGWTEAAGDALFALLVELDAVDPRAGSAADLHFIGHGLGAVVTSETVERLAHYSVPVDHVTYLDPHDFDQGLVIANIKAAGQMPCMSMHGKMRSMETRSTMASPVMPIRMAFTVMPLGMAFTVMP